MVSLLFDIGDHFAFVCPGDARGFFDDIQWDADIQIEVPLEDLIQDKREVVGFVAYGIICDFLP